METNDISPNYWGMEAICDIAGCDITKATDPHHIAAFSTDLVQRLGMEPAGNPMLKHFGTGDLAGWTLLQFITTSNITAHFNDCDGSCYLNVFSCASFEPEVVEECIREYFNPTTIYTTFLVRNAHK